MSDSNVFCDGLDLVFINGRNDTLGCFSDVVT